MILTTTFSPSRRRVRVNNSQAMFSVQSTITCARRGQVRFTWKTLHKNKECSLEVHLIAARSGVRLRGVIAITCRVVKEGLSDAFNCSHSFFFVRFTRITPCCAVFATSSYSPVTASREKISPVDNPRPPDAVGLCIRAKSHSSARNGL